MGNRRYEKYKKSYEKYRRENKDRMKQLKSTEKYKRARSDSEFNKIFGGNREIVLERDNWSCRNCGMNQEQHIIVFGRSITIDHKNGDRENNSLENLQTLCLKCHGIKDRKRGIIMQENEVKNK